MNMLKLGLPAGSLSESTTALMAKAGFEIFGSSRSYTANTADPEVSAIRFRAQEMARYVADGVLDAGITGQDWIDESGVELVEVAELIYAKQKLTPVRWVLAVPEESVFQSVQDLEGKLIATELVKVTQRYFHHHGVKARIEFSWGATEVKARLVDAIVDVTETGSSLRANNLRVIDTVATSTTKFIANQAAWNDPWKRTKMENLAMLLQGAINAKGKVGLKMNIETSKIEDVLRLLPAMRRPTISQLAEPEWSAIETIIDESVVRDIVPELKRAGAEGIIEYPLNKVIP
ncbi:MAG: ATP phosphoribosyltransferase [Planctomycetota bacterium]|nr:ATP phosphoribosyltransferase [Planctomycetota bacterium]MDA1140133.1 ATP phosphoribosyltransferase [Planctomycetota bacterium]